MAWRNERLHGSWILYTLLTWPTRISISPPLILTPFHPVCYTIWEPDTAVIWYTPIQGVIFEPAIIGPAMAQRRTLPLLKVLFAKTASRTDANANAFANAGVRERLPSPPGLANKQRTNANSGCSPTLFVGVFANARHCVRQICLT